MSHRLQKMQMPHREKVIRRKHLLMLLTLCQLLRPRCTLGAQAHVLGIVFALSRHLLLVDLALLLTRVWDLEII